MTRDRLKMDKANQSREMGNYPTKNVYLEQTGDKKKRQTKNTTSVVARNHLTGLILEY